MIPLQAVLFWAFGTGATFAVSAARQLQHWRRFTGTAPGGLLKWRAGSRAANPYLCLTALFAGVLMAPTGLFLLWQNPSWATMHAADAHDGVWAGFVLLYAGGVVVGALIGFLLAQALCLMGMAYWAFLLAVGAHFLLFGTLVHGWDGSGYRRFLSTGRPELAGWPRDSVINNALEFLTSGTFLALLVLGAAVLGTLLLAEVGWLVEGWALPGADAARRVPRMLAVTVAAAGVYGLPLLGAVLASVLVRALGWGPGLGLFAVGAWLALLPRRTPVRWLYGLVGLPDRHWRTLEDEERHAVGTAA
ncbi:hypothetical protein [Streptomyces iconiensis]|uniref:Uncharacterized protein n=1 Tax=Streptomyces iconiensis TaxID=1384038 RepID=A0ABT6ZR44_9ACTN|nr:hypothetical protein [Streptomyces iconiensis]MDJ1131322.1 hypothetical protein [Streptomyces iconiensis]